MSISEKCPQCGGVLKKRTGSHGAFLGCSAYPKCTYTKSIEKDLSDVWVNASSVGAAKFCPNTVYLDAFGVKGSLKNQLDKEFGSLLHRLVSGKASLLQIFSQMIRLLILKFRSRFMIRKK